MILLSEINPQIRNVAIQLHFMIFIGLEDWKRKTTFIIQSGYKESPINRTVMVGMSLIGDFLRKVVDWLVSLVSRGSYPAIILTMAGESALLPIPSEVVMPLAGFLVSTGEMDFFLATTSGVVGNLIGSVVSYYLGLKYGRNLLNKYRKYLFLNEEHISKSEFLFQRWGKEAVLLGRMLPGIRTVISFPAGVFKVPIKDLVIYTILGSIPWNAALVASGILLRENWGVILKYSHHLLIIGIAIMILFILMKLKGLRKPKNPSNPIDASGEKES